MKKLFVLLILVSSIPALAQITTPRPSPLSTVEQKVGLTDISIEYSRPSVKGRTIFGELVQFDKMWRLGANASTKIEFSKDVTIAGQEVPAGKYALYAIPNKDKWTMVLHKNLSYWGTGGKDYQESEDQLRFDVVPSSYGVKIETMTFNFSNVNGEACDVELLWENTQVKFSIKTEVDKVVMAEIESKMKGISASTYYQAARYYLDNDKDMEQALVWIDKSLESSEKFWMLRQKSLILGKLERYKDAIAVAEKSKEMAKEAGNDDYVRMNDKSIAEWNKK